MTTPQLLAFAVIAGMMAAFLWGRFRYDLVAAVVREARPGDHVLVMSNGGFGGVHGKLLGALQAREAASGRKASG